MLLQGWKVAHWETEKVSKKIGKNPKSCHLNFKSCYINVLIFLKINVDYNFYFSLFTIVGKIGEEEKLET